MNEMKKIAKKLAKILGLLLLAAQSPGQPVGPLKTVRVVVENWNLQSTSYNYPLTSPSIVGPGQRAVTVGSSVTVTACTLCTAPFQFVSVGDTLIFFVNDTQVYRYVATKASSTSITVDTAIDLSTNGTVGYSFSYRKVTIGTTATDGWFRIGGGDLSSAVAYQIDTLGAASIDVRIECRMSNAASGFAQPISVFERNVTVAGIGTAGGGTGRTTVEILPHFTECRVGMKGNTLATANLINIYVNSY